MTEKQLELETLVLKVALFLGVAHPKGGAAPSLNNLLIMISNYRVYSDGTHISVGDISFIVGVLISHGYLRDIKFAMDAMIVLTPEGIEFLKEKEFAYCMVLSQMLDNDKIKVHIISDEVMFVGAPGLNMGLTHILDRMKNEDCNAYN